MTTGEEPLFKLSVAEYIALTKQVIEDTLKEKGKDLFPHLNESLTDKILTIEELQSFLHCSKTSIHYYKKLGLPYYRVGKKILFRMSEVLNFMKVVKGKWSKNQA